MNEKVSNQKQEEPKDLVGYTEEGREDRIKRNCEHPSMTLSTNRLVQVEVEEYVLVEHTWICDICRETEKELKKYISTER